MAEVKEVEVSDIRGEDPVYIIYDEVTEFTEADWDKLKAWFDHYDYVSH